MKKQTWTALLAIALILFSFFSFFVLADKAGSAEAYEQTLSVLDEKEKTVLKITASATAASALISAIPDDTCTPIADQIMDISGYFLIVLCAILLEKFLLPIASYVALRYIIPIGCIIIAINLLLGKEYLYSLGAKLVVFGLALILVIPTCVKGAELIDSTYKDSIEETISQSIEADAAVADETTEAKVSQGGNIFSAAATKLSEIKDDIPNKIEDAKAAVGNYFEALAVMLVTTCLIPLLIISFYVWLCKIILGLDIPTPQKLSFKRKPIDAVSQIPGA